MKKIPRRNPMRFCLCCGTTTETPSIPSCWDHWQLLPEDLRSSIIKNSARGQLTLYAKAATEAIAVWRKAGAWRPKRRATEMYQKSNVMPLAVLQRLLFDSSTGASADDRSPHEAPPRGSADARPAAAKHRWDVAVLRAVPAQRPDQVRPPYPAVGRRHIERQVKAMRAVYGMQPQGSDAAASGLG